MRIQILDYQVGPHTFRMVKPSDFNIFKALPSLIPFITTIDTTQKVIFETEIDDDETATKRTIAKTPDDICFNWEDADCIIRPLPHSSHLVSITPRKSGKNYWMECNDNFRQCFIHLPACRTETPAPENETNFVLNNFLMMLYAFNAARHHTLLMHASVVATETGKGYLFLGKSGTGKSKLYEGEIPVTQFGIIEYLAPVLFNKNSTIKVYFDPVTGGLLKVDREESK